MSKCIDFIINCVNICCESIQNGGSLAGDGFVQLSVDDTMELILFIANLDS